jgi:rod shape determining protein RodA
VLERPWYTSLNYPLAAAAIALSVFGLIAIKSATLHAPDARGDFGHQAVYLAVGIAAMAVLAFTDYHLWYRFSKPIYFLTLVMLTLVAFAGHSALGAQRWIGFGPVVFQPSEPAKLLVTLSVAAVLANPKRTFAKWWEMLVPIAAVAVPAALVLKQPDLGTALVLVAILTTMLFFALPNLMRFSAYAASAISTAVLSPLFLHAYQRERLLVFLDPSHDPQGSGWSLIQSKIAIGSGELTGKGLYNGTQTQLGFVPEHATDFIFTVIGEEFGFVGAMLLLALYGALLWMGMLAVAAARDRYGLLVAAGIVTMLAFHILVNIGMTVGIMPVTGIPLPFVSYGGSSLVTCLASVGVLLNIHLQRTRMTFAAESR